jgi:hypothetical protein
VCTIRQSEGGVYLDDSFGTGGGFTPSSCRACKQPILEGEHSTRIRFESDPDGAQGFTGEYHTACSKPFDSLAHAINMLSRFGP